MPPLRSIADVKPKMKNWTAKVTVQEKMYAMLSRNGVTRYQKFVLVDSEGGRVQGILFDEAIDKMGSKLQLYKRYSISNADVKHIEERFQSDGLCIQWIIGTNTVVEEENDAGTSNLNISCNFTPAKDLPLYADNVTKTVDIMAVVIEVQNAIVITKQPKDSIVTRIVLINQELQPILLSLWNEFSENEGKAVLEYQSNFPIVLCRRLKVVTYNGISLSTRNDSIILIDPPTEETAELKEWAKKNENQIASLPKNTNAFNLTSESFLRGQYTVNKIADILVQEKKSWVKGCISFEHILQKYWYMSCDKCRRLTSAEYHTTFTCNHCNERHIAVPRCRFDVDLTDDTGTITAAIFGEIAENLLGFTAMEAMDHYSQNKELPLKNTHMQLKDKEFIAQVKPGLLKENSSKQRYTIGCFFEENVEKSIVQDPDADTSQSIGSSTVNEPHPQHATETKKKCLQENVRMGRKNVNSEESLTSAITGNEVRSGKKPKKG